MDIAFHCNENTAFNRADQFVRAFIYKNYSIAPHNHDFYEINIVIGGSGIHRIESSTMTVKKGDVFVIPPQISHAYYDTDRLDVCHVILKNEFIRSNEKEARGVEGYIQLMEIEPFLRKNNTESMFLHLDAAQLSEIQHDLKYLEDNGAFDRQDCAAIQSHSVWRLIYSLSYFFNKQMCDVRKNKTEKFNIQIVSTLEYIHQHFSEKITVESLSKRVFLSRSTFLRNFGAVCGCSPTEYLKRYRVSKAVDMLKNSTASKTDIAHFCGFYDLPHMIRSIKQSGISISVREIK